MNVVLKKIKSEAKEKRDYLKTNRSPYKLFQVSYLYASLLYRFLLFLMKKVIFKKATPDVVKRIWTLSCQRFKRRACSNVAFAISKEKFQQYI